MFKVLVIGDSSVGKTAMVARYCHNRWLHTYKVTLGGVLLRSYVRAEQPTYVVVTVRLRPDALRLCTFFRLPS